MKTKTRSSQEIIDDIKKSLGVPIRIESEEEEPAKFEPTTEIGIQGQYLRRSEVYRRKISLCRDQKEMMILALQCIRDLTGDELFYKTNIRKIV